MDKENLKRQTINGLFWQFCQRGSGQLISFCITVVLARILTPEDYGVVALASMFNILVGIFVTCSMGMALVQKKDVDELDYNTVFYSSLFMSFVLYAFVYFGAPYFASLYDNDHIIPIMRVLALAMPIGAFSMVQSAIVTRQMAFKKFFYSSLWSQIITSVIAIAMAYMGFGAWALVAQSIASTLASNYVLYRMVRWHPKWMYSWSRFNALFPYAWKKTAASFMGTLCNQLKGYLIGYHYTTADLAFFNRGEGLPEMLRNSISGTIDGVLFPALSKVQDDVEGLKRGIRRSIMTSTFFVCPVLFGLAATADKLVPIIYSAKWSPAVPFMQVACVTLIVVLINNTNLQTLYAIGRTDVVLKQEFIKKPVMLAILAFAITISPIAISVGIFIHSVHELFWTSYANSKLIKYSLFEQLNDVKSNVIIALVMAGVVYIVGLFIANPYIAACVQIILGMILYLGICHLLNNESYMYCKDVILGKFFNKK